MLKKTIEEAVTIEDSLPRSFECSDKFLKRFITDFDRRFSEISFARQEAGVLHNSFEWGYGIYECVKNNNRQDLIALLNSGGDIRYGILSDEPLRSAKDLVICLISTVTEFAMLDRIINPEVAFTASDTFIRLVEDTKCRDDLAPEALACLLKIMDLIENYRQHESNYLVIQAKNYVYKHFHEKIIIKDMAESLGVSTEYLSRIFHASEGMKLIDFIQKERVERGKNLLIYSDRSIQDIGSYLAFSTQSHFSEVFKRYTGSTPARYRLQYSSQYRNHI